MSRDKWLPKSDLVIDLGPNNANLVPLAQDVALDRARAVSEVMCHLAAIRSLQGPGYGANATVTCVAATVQDTTAQHGQQAAHLLPGMIKVNNVDVWELADPSSNPGLQTQIARLHAATHMSFAETNILPAVFNRADSQAEVMAGGRGLKQLFGEVVQHLWSNARTDSNRPLAIDTEVVFASLNSWFHRVNALYALAAERKTTAWVNADANQNATAEERAQEGMVLEQYAYSLGIQSATGFVYQHASQVFSRYERLGH